MNILVTADLNWGIAKDKQALVSIPADMKYFRDVTAGKVVVMGRRTLERFPGGRALPGRTNIVLSSKKISRPGPVIVCENLPALRAELLKYDPETIFCIGGERVYRTLLPYCDAVYVTKINHVFAADAWFTDLDTDPDWELTGDCEEQTYFNLEYRCLLYRRKKGRPAASLQSLPDE